MNFSFRACVLLGCIMLLVGCAAPARVDQMVASGQPTQRVAQSVLRGNVTVSEVNGGRDTNPMWKSNVGGSEFSQALEGSLQAVGLLSANRQAGRFSLVANLQNLDQPSFGLDMTVTATVNYVVLERASGKEIYQRTISLPYTAKWGDAFMGVERLKLANEGAIKTNITQLIDDLFNLKLDGLVINGQPLKIIAPQTNEEKLIELKRLSDAGLITKDVYLEQQKAILTK